MMETLASLTSPRVRDGIVRGYLAREWLVLGTAHTHTRTQRIRAGTLSMRHLCVPDEVGDHMLKHYVVSCSPAGPQ